MKRKRSVAAVTLLCELVKENNHLILVNQILYFIRLRLKRGRTNNFITIIFTNIQTHLMYFPRQDSFYSVS